LHKPTVPDVYPAINSKLQLPGCYCCCYLFLLLFCLQIVLDMPLKIKYTLPPQNFKVKVYIKFKLGNFSLLYDIIFPGNIYVTCGTS